MSGKVTKPAWRQRGVTLLETAAVLGAIGLVVGGASIALDVMREAEQRRIIDGFVKPWKVAYDLYHQRTGAVLGDSSIAPTLMVNGFEAEPDRMQDTGLPSGYRNTGLRICEGQGYARDAVGDGDPEPANQQLRTLLAAANITLPVGRAEGAEDRYLYKDGDGNVVELQICFQWNPPNAASGSGNVMVLRGLTPELATKLDLALDGQVNAFDGRFRQQGVQQGAERPSDNAWRPENGNGGRLASDDDGIAARLLTAHWQMDR